MRSALQTCADQVHAYSSNRAVSIQIAVRVNFTQAFILVVLCLLFNERFTKASDKDFVFLEHYAGEATMSQEIQDSRCGRGYSAAAGTILVSVLCVALGANWVIEQPGLRLPFLVDALWTYPRPFGQEMAELLPLFNKSPPMRPTQMLDASTVERLRCLDMGEDDWADAGLWDLLRYVYGAKGLCIPGQWKELEGALTVAAAEVKTEPGTETQVERMQNLPHLLQKFSLLQATTLAQQTELNKLRETQTQEPQKAKPERPAPVSTQESPAASVRELGSPRGSKRAHPETPVKKNPKASKAPSEVTTNDDDSSEAEAPKVLKGDTLDKLEKDKIRRIVSPKKGSGNLEVPEDIFDMWKDAGKGRQKLFQMWAKSGRVKGGFYSKEDMKSELGSRIEKIVAWAEKNNLVRTCEYDEETLEHWVNTRTLGTMTKEDFEMMQRERKYEGEGGDELVFKPDVHLDGFDFSDDDRMIHKGKKNVEGEHQKSASPMMSIFQVASRMKEYLRQVLKSKNSLDSFVDKIKEIEVLYEEMGDARAEGKAEADEGTQGDFAIDTSCLCHVAGATESAASRDLDQRLISETTVASKILWHCVRMINAVRKENGGDALCVFKIGLTANPLQRRASYLEQNFQNFTVIHKVCRAELLGMLEMLEAALIVPAKDLVIDAQTAWKRDPCEVLAKIAKVPISNADAPLFAILRKHGLAWPVDFSYAKAGKEAKYPFLSPRAMLETLSAEGYFHRVVGLPVHLASEGLDFFWKKFRGLYPRHSVFENNSIDFTRLIPYYLHGDGGRGYKKESVEILSMFPALGSGSRRKAVDLSSKRARENEIELGINLTGSSGATRFLFTVVTNLVAKTDDKLFDDIMEVWSEQLKAILDDGFEVGGSTWRIIILGFTGDSPYVKKVAKTTRSFHNVRKRHTSKNVQKGCCWLCNAGYDSPEDGIFYPFEHLGFTEPAWLQTCRLNNPVPWDGNGGRLLQHMLLDKDDTPAAFYKADFFHVWHAGVGQDYCSSSMVYCMKVLFGRGSVAKDVSVLNEALKNWLPSSKQKLHCAKITEDLLGYNGTREYPEGKWSKNMDTAVFTNFIVYLLERPDFQPQLENDILAAGKAIGQVIRTCLEADYFMSSAQCQTVIKNGHKFLTAYSTLVNKCYDLSLCLFKLRPKVHYLNHAFLKVFEEWRASSSACNPLAESTFMSEDFVGRAARLSRRVSPRAIAIKTLQRYALFMQTSLSKETVEMMDVSMLT
ncbi:unnamed protein product [Symbiodinium sp. CCMP2456]|nr:unnamed protein product [Symbiodinium sp. CCMP2456]